MLERASHDGTFEQAAGPFTSYRRTITREPDDDGGRWRETTTYRWSLPWFAWVFALPVRWSIARRGAAPTHAAHHHAAPTPWWAPPDRLDPRALMVLGLLAAASMSSAFVNTLFTQTVNFAADDFGVSDTGIGVGGAVVRVGIILVLPFAVLADRIGRRRVVTAMAVAAPLVTAAGALAPTFPILVATQAIGRPLGLALDFLVAVVAAEEMPRNSRAYAVSVLAMASGLGAGVAVMALPLADISASSWRLVYLVALVWLVVAVDIARRLARDEALRAPARHRAAPRPPPVRRAGGGRPADEPLRRPGQPVPERLPGGHPGLLGHDDRHLHAGHGDAGRDRPDPRRAGRRPQADAGGSSPPASRRRRRSGCCPTASADR